MSRLLTIDEAAEILRRPPATLRYWRATHTGPPSARVMGRVMYREDELRAWIEAQFDGGHDNPSAA